MNWNRAGLYLSCCWGKIWSQLNAWKQKQTIQFNRQFSRAFVSTVLPAASNAFCCGFLGRVQLLAQAGLEPLILLYQPSECWSYRHAPLHPETSCIFNVNTWHVKYEEWRWWWEQGGTFEIVKHVCILTGNVLFAVGRSCSKRPARKWSLS